MEIQIVDTPLELNVYGFGGVALDTNYTGMAFKLSEKMWEIVKSRDMKTKGQNVWVYQNDHKVFAGVELAPKSIMDEFEDRLLPAELEYQLVVLPKYAYYKHIRPYSLIKEVGQTMTNQLNSKGYQTTLPYVEIYGHWNRDETKCETELFVALK